MVNVKLWTKLGKMLLTDRFFSLHVFICMPQSQSAEVFFFFTFYSQRMGYDLASDQILVNLVVHKHYSTLPGNSLFQRGQDKHSKVTLPNDTWLLRYLWCNREIRPHQHRDAWILCPQRTGSWIPVFPGASPIDVLLDTCEQIDQRTGLWRTLNNKILQMVCNEVNWPRRNKHNNKIKNAGN